MENVKLGGKIYRGVQAIKMDTESGGTVLFGETKSVVAQAEFDNNVIIDFSKVDFAETYIVE